MVLGQRHHADRGAAADAAIGAEHVGEQIGHSAGDKIGVCEIRLADHEVQRADERHHIIEITDCLPDARKAIDPSLAGDRLGVLDSDLGADASGVKRFAIRQIGDMPRQHQQVSHSAERPHLAIIGAVVGAGRQYPQALCCA